jgi:hypothetical protein
MMVDKLKEIAEIPVEDPLSTVVAVFSDAKLAEAASMGMIAIERVDAIEKLEEKLGTNPAVDELDLQGLLEGAPWLIHPEWTVLQANKTFDSLRSAFERWYEKTYRKKVVTTPIGSKSRPDFVMLPVMGNVEIVEIKKADHSLTDDEFKRFRGYYDAMEKFLTENPDFRKEFSKTHITLLCDKLNLSRDIELAFDHLEKEGILTRKTWEGVLAVSKKRHEEFIERRQTTEQSQPLKST